MINSFHLTTASRLAWRFPEKQKERVPVLLGYKHCAPNGAANDPPNDKGCAARAYAVPAAIRESLRRDGFERAFAGGPALAVALVSASMS